MIDDDQPRAGSDLSDDVLQILGWRYWPRFAGDSGGYWYAPDGTQVISEERPAVSEEMAACYQWVICWLADKQRYPPVGYSVELSNRYVGPWRAVVVAPTYQYDQEAQAMGATAMEAVCRAVRKSHAGRMR